MPTATGRLHRSAKRHNLAAVLPTPHAAEVRPSPCDHIVGRRPHRRVRRAVPLARGWLTELRDVTGPDLHLPGVQLRARESPPYDGRAVMGVLCWPY